MFNSFVWVILLIMVCSAMLMPLDGIVPPCKFEKMECTKTTLDQFNECKDLGVEEVGFLSSNHFYSCDGQKVTKNCLEYDFVNVTQSPSIIRIAFHSCELENRK